METRWFTIWTGLCPVCGKNASKENEGAAFLSYWKCGSCPSIGRVKRDPYKETFIIYLDNPEVVYKDYPPERTFEFNYTPNGSTEGKTFTVRESHLTEEHQQMLRDDVISYYESMPDQIQKMIRNKLWRDK